MLGTWNVWWFFDHQENQWLHPGRTKRAIKYWVPWNLQPSLVGVISPINRAENLQPVHGFGGLKVTSETVILIFCFKRPYFKSINFDAVPAHLAGNLCFFVFSVKTRYIWPNNHEKPKFWSPKISSSLKMIPIYTCDQDSQLIKFGCSVKIFFTFSHWWSLQSSRNLTPRQVDSMRPKMMPNNTSCESKEGTQSVRNL